MMMVERVARAMCVAVGHDPDSDWRNGGDAMLGVEIPASRAQRWRLYEAQARAAIEAMREPTPAMLEASQETRRDCLQWSSEPGEGLDDVDFEPAWQVMIDAALRE
jgi:hypothetical protein